MMKIRTRTLALPALILIGLAACDEGFLDEVPRDALSPLNFYNSEKDAIAAVNSVYDAANNLSRDWIRLTELPTEMGMANPNGIDMDFYTWQASSGLFNSMWNVWYDAVAPANAVIENLTGKTTIPAPIRDRVIGEAKFLRAMTYFNLVRTFGGVPLWTKVVIASDDPNLPRSTAPQVYELIIQDLKEAAPALPLTYTGADIGRVTRGAAHALLAKVYLQRGATLNVSKAQDFAAAAAYADTVIRGGRYRLLPDYASVFSQFNENNAEVIFDSQGAYGSTSLGTWFTRQFAPPQMMGTTSGNVTHKVEYPFFASYAPTDTRKAGTWMLSFPKKPNGVIVTYSDTTRAVRDLYGMHLPAPRKGIDVTPGPGDETATNFVLLRYAEVLLIRAEALNEINNGPTPEAIALVNQIRTRAGIGNLPAAQTAGYAAFKDALFEELRWEFGFELHGHWDSVRHWSWAKKRVEDSINDWTFLNSTTTTGTAVRTFVPRLPLSAPRPFRISDHFQLMPIPLNAIRLNPKLDQNPGYGNV